MTASTTPGKTPFRAGGAQPAAAEAEASTGAAVLLADCSEFQMEIADAIYLAWSKAIAIRALYGSAHDDGAWYGGQRRALLHAGGARVVFIYQYLVSSQSGAVQAQAFRRLVGAIQPGEVFVADFEEGAKPVLSEWYGEMLKLYGQGIHPYLWTYSGLDFGEAEGALPVEWLAAYQPAEPASPHRLWQFTDAYPVPGVGTADCSVFRGSIDELAALAWPEPAPTWFYGPPRHLQALGGHTSVRLDWQPPAGAPAPPDHYAVFIYHGTVCTRDTIVASYPRTVAASPWEGGGLGRGRIYTAHVVASGPAGMHVAPGVYASVTFKTG